jgi:hypothetical protein
MPMPLVSSEIIESIREQSLRKNMNTLYCMDVLNEIKIENPNLAEAIKETVKHICSKHGIDATTDNGLELMVNMANLAVSVYQSIKQQMICDEL